LISTRSYHPETGQAEGINANHSVNTVLDLDYTYDVYGNLETRSTAYGGGTTETFLYDDVQRLTTSTRTYAAGGSHVVGYTFDASGSIKTKGDYRQSGTTPVAGTYHYEPLRPHVLERVDYPGGNHPYDHDNNGNTTGRDGVTIDYNAFNQPILIEDGLDSTTFEYGADLQRYKQVTPTGATIYSLDKLMEIETSGLNVDYRHYLGDVAILTKTGDLNDPSPGIRYVFRDRLGSVAALGNDTATSFERRGYDAYGKPRGGNWANKAPPEINSAITDRGFTDHEHLDDWQLIHMNGRVFDYNLGRFTSIDPIIQSPGNSQSINGYSYIMNNPLSGTDPSGYFAVREECQAKPVACRAVMAAEGLGGRSGVGVGTFGGLLSLTVPPPS
jgi:RHS repeat-associated protein